MSRTRLRFLFLVLVAAAGAAYYLLRRGPSELVLTGIVTTSDVIVSPQIAGRVNQLLVTDGEAVHRDQLIAVIEPGELQADRAYYEHNASGFEAQVKQGEAALRYQERASVDQTRQAEATLAATEAQIQEALVDQHSARIKFERSQQLSKDGIEAAQDFDQARAALDASTARIETLKRQADVQRAAVTLTRAAAEQVSVRRHELQANEQQLAAANAQRTKADVRLGYSEVRSPIEGIVDVRAARQGEVVEAGEPIIRLINPDDLWVRADVEETYIDRIKLGDKLTVRLPSGATAEGTVFYRGADAAFATQRDVSRTKRDIKTFEVRLRVDNKDRRLAVGMTAYVLLPLPR